MKAKLSPNLISFVLVRRGEWLLKVSVYKSFTILVAAQNIFDPDKVVCEFFTDQNLAADFIEQLVNS